jgi:hypothetical protein
VDVAEVNLLIIHKIVPFLEQFTKDDPFLQLRLKRDTWKRLRQIADESADVVTTELAKKVAHFAERAKRLSKKRIEELLMARTEVKPGEDIVMEGLQCLACKNRSLTTFSGWDVDTDEFGHALSGWMYFGMRCKVCGLGLDQEDIELIIAQFDKFIGEGQEEEKGNWERAIIEPDYSELYSDRYSLIAGAVTCGNALWLDPTLGHLRHCIIADAVIFAERILKRIDSECPPR